MAVAHHVLYTASAGAVIRGGRYASVSMTGAVTAGGVVPAGSMTQAQTAMTGALPVGGATPSGRMSPWTAMTGAVTVGGVVPVVTGSLQWQFADGATLNTGRNTTTALATGVPAGSTAYAWPGLLPGQALQISGTTLNLVGDSSVPTVNGDSAGSGVDFASDVDQRIVVVDSPYATIRLIRAGSLIGTYGKGQSTPTTWWNAMFAAQDGDVIEISPGAINASEADCANYYNGLDSCGMAIVRGVTIRPIDEPGWRLFPEGATIADNRNGICIYHPFDGGEISGRLTISIQGGNLVDQFKTNGCGIRIRNTDAPSFAGYHQSVTMRDMVIGRTSGLSLSGVNGFAQNLTLEDSLIFNCGNHGGQEHNLYMGAQNMTLRGVRSYRDRGWIATPYSSDAAYTIDGHLAKLDAANGTIEGCCLDGSELGDYSLAIQMKAGGNWTIRGTVIVDSPWTRKHRGAIEMCRELQENGTPNYKSWAGSFGNSLLMEGCTFAGHCARPIFGFFEQAHAYALRPPTGGSWTDAERMSSLIVRDNVGMVPSTMRSGYGSTFVLPGFSSQAADRPMWINNDPTEGASWGARGNVIVPYDAAELAFATADNRALRSYPLASSVAADVGTRSIRQFVWPRRSRDVSYGYKGVA